MTDHTCHAHGCTSLIQPRMLMCKRHWAMVPRVIQRRVLRHFRPGQCDDKHPSIDWLTAADAAIATVREREMAASDAPQTDD